MNPAWDQTAKVLAMKVAAVCLLSLALALGPVGPAQANDSCIWAFDNFCDDPSVGGTGACSAGTDDTDCGLVSPGGGGGAGGPDSCFPFDGDCDEPNGLNNCPFGTDTTDCSNPNSNFGNGSGFAGGAGGGFGGLQSPCPFTNDGDCDEPNGLGLCAWGTDVRDCSNPNSNFGNGSGFAGRLTPQTPARPQIPSTQEGVQIQTALNYFGFNAGMVDGQIGGGTRAAIERFQAGMGFPVNGRNLPADQLGTLLGAYSWATTQGGAQQTGLGGVPLLIAYTNRLQGGGTPTAQTPLMPARPMVPTQPPRGGGATVGGTCPTSQTSDGLIVSYAAVQTTYFVDAQGDTVAFTAAMDQSFALGTVYSPLGLMVATWESTIDGQPMPGTSQTVDYAGPAGQPPLPADGVTWSGSETARFEDGRVEQFATSVTVGTLGTEMIAGCAFTVRPIIVARTPTVGGPPYTDYFLQLVDFGLAYYVGGADEGFAPQIEVATGLSNRPEDGIAPPAALPSAFGGITAPTVGGAAAPAMPTAPAFPAPQAPARKE